MKKQFPGWLVVAVVGRCAAPEVTVVESPRDAGGADTRKIDGKGSGQAVDLGSESPPVDRLDAGKEDVAGGPDVVDATTDKSARTDTTLAADLPVRVDGGPPATGIDKFRWEVPCNCSNCVTVQNYACGWDLAKITGKTTIAGGGWTVENARIFEGDPNVIYTVVLRFRGVVETNTYADAAGVPDTKQTAAPHFHVGGKVLEYWMWYSLATSDPKETYFLNAFSGLQHQPYTIDYTATIKIKGGATVTFALGDTRLSRGGMIANSQKVVVPNVPPAPLPFNGEFIQMDVVSVTP